MSTPLLTKEQMRADIAEMLHETPDAIRDDDDLMDYGVDSMRLLNLIVKWGEQGVEIDFADMAEAPTLANWWAAAEAQMAGKAGGN
jgi:bifunctional isochorismate lyase/aryl carrier protein